MAKGAVHQLQLSFLIATWKDEVVLQCIIFDTWHDRSIHRAYHIFTYVGSTKKYECWYVWYGLTWYVIWYDNVWSKIVSANGELLDVQLDVAVNNLKRVDPKEKSWGNGARASQGSLCTIYCWCMHSLCEHKDHKGRCGCKRILGDTPDFHEDGSRHSAFAKKVELPEPQNEPSRIQIWKFQNFGMACGTKHGRTMHKIYIKKWQKLENPQEHSWIRPQILAVG